jgi:hypothetical protein
MERQILVTCGKWEAQRKKGCTGIDAAQELDFTQGIW